MKLSAILFLYILSGFSSSYAQNYVFEDPKAKIKLNISQQNDSTMTLKVEFANKSKASIYVDAQKPLTYTWLSKGNLLVVGYGSDSKAFAGSEFPVAQIKGGETKEFFITVPRARLHNKFKMSLAVSYFESSESASEDLLTNASVRQKRGKWNQAEYYLPVLLKN